MTRGRLGPEPYFKRSVRPVADRSTTFFVVLAVPPLAVLLALAWLQGEHLSRALVLGTVFGVTYAALTVLLRRWRA